MGHKLHNRIEIWKKLLLDFGKRNRLINFLEGKRSNVRIMTPSFDRLWELVVANEKEIVFPYAKKVQVDDEGEEVYETVINLKSASNLNGNLNCSKELEHYAS